ncbi:hypothetical protein BDZ94DRAFT_1251348 [Collybia nuda]|uniref:THUMP domain-containing protein n=1 Tax=Collybia nuda TaxID=64659 RepID=A0A9P6CHN3_9AGAR|nr:hypothetical protein BDZ94DRAFT_1251348 [Collybia nuda]
MADTSKQSQSIDRRKKKYRSDGTPIWGKRYIEGPGVWVSCVKGKESQTIAEIYELFESVASELWPIGEPKPGESAVEDSESELSIEAQVAKEVSAMKRPRPEPRFVNCQTNTPCVVFISCKPPVDPVELIYKHIINVEKTGITRTRYTHRLVPVSDSCVANLPEIQTLCNSIFSSYFSHHPDKTFKYKIELRMRNHTTIPRPTIINHIASCVPDSHTVALADPELFILVEVFKSICGISIVENYYKLQKFNVMEIANSRNSLESQDERRIIARD